MNRKMLRKDHDSLTAPPASADGSPLASPPTCCPSLAQHLGVVGLVVVKDRKG